MVEFDRSAFISKFQEEAQDLLQRLNEGVITLEGDPGNRELIDQMLRDAHTLKGSSRMVGLIDISDVAHRLEDIMVKVRDGGLEYTPDLSDSFFEALDAIVYLSDNRGENVDGVLDLAGLQRRLSGVAEGTAAAAAPNEDLPAPLAAVAETEAGVAGGSEVTSGSPASCTASEGSEGDADAELRSKVQATIRVRASQVDSLLNLTSEVVIGQIKSERRAAELRQLQSRSVELWQAWSHARTALASAGAAAGLSDEDFSELDSLLSDHRKAISSLSKAYAEDVSRMSLVVSELQEQGMQLRMLPANTIFQAFPRAMRDLARDFGKDVDLVIEGGETELDKKVLEEINDPLVHIMRNAVDHGIEDAGTRIQLGKPARGTIRLSARQEGDRIVIEISDDGAGIDPEKVRAAAVRKGYLTAADAAAMSDREATYLIFEAGFSTATIITEVSGRGVGMDVVREFIVEKLKGSLDIHTEIGKGTTFRLTLPLTLAIIRALLLRVGSQVFALPTAAVEETLRVDPADIVKVEGRDVIRRQRRTIPLVRMSDLLGVPETGPDGLKVPIVTLGYSGHRMGFIVDAFQGEQQIVIKPLGEHLQRVENVAGVTVLGAGDVVPILNVPDLMSNGRTRSGQRVGPAPRTLEPGLRSILICEDSFTTRELERSIFEAAGYHVETAMDGSIGLGKLREGLHVDAVVTDVQMPNMTGFELTKAIKSDGMLAHIPVVIVTSLERDEEKAEGVDAGADAYITKSVFNQDTLLDTVERLIG